MNKLLYAAALTGCLFLAPDLAKSQIANTSLCVPVTSTTSGVAVTSCVPVSSANPLPISGSTGGTAPPNNFGTPPGAGTVGYMNVTGTETPGTSSGHLLGIQGNPSAVPVPVSISSWNSAAHFSMNNSILTIKSGAGILGVYECDNPNATTVYLEFFNTGTVTLGSTLPFWVSPIYAGGKGGNLGGVYSGGAGIWASVVTAANGTGNPGTAINCSMGFL